MAKSTDSASNDILQASFLTLPGTALIHLGRHFYESFMNGNYDESSLLKQVASLKHDANSVKYGAVKYPNSFKNCDHIELVRYFDAETTYAFYFDLNGEACANSSTFLHSGLIKGQTLSLKFLNTDYATEPSGPSDVKSVTFNSRGVSEVKLPRNSFLVLSQPYSPPDIKDIL